MTTKISTKTFSFENAILKSNSINEEGVLIIPENKELFPLFVPKNKSVPFFQSNYGSHLNEYFDKDDLDEIFSSSSNIIDVWGKSVWGNGNQLESECYTWTLLDINSNIILELSQVDNYYDNILEVSIADPSVLDEVIRIAYEQNIVLSKIMYDKYMEIENLNKQDIFELLKNYGDDGSYWSKVENILKV